MNKKKPLNELVQLLTQTDVNTLYSIYTYRCLNVEQIWKLHYRSELFEEDISMQIANDRVLELTKLQLIKQTTYRPEMSVSFLTPLGVEAVRHFFSLPTNIYDHQKKIVNRGYFRASELEIFPKNINHQVHINDFVIDALTQIKHVPVNYYDEKYASQYTNIRPDGIISFPDVDVFLEMDMATESKKQLFEKWENYRSFLNSREYDYREKKIVVFFIISGTLRIKERIDLIKFTIYERLHDVFDQEFDFYIGTHEELLSYLLGHFIPALTKQDPRTRRLEQTLMTQQNMALSDGERLSKVFPKTAFKWYMRKLNESQKITVEEGRIQEFLVDDYFMAPTSIISKISYMDKHNVFFNERYGRDIAYVVICESEEQIKNDLKMNDLLGLKNIFYTTEERLRHYPFHEAVFQFDLLGNTYHFENNGLEKRVFEAAE